MDWDEPKAPSSSVITVGENLDRHSIDELKLRIAALQEEITRIEAEIAKKQAHGAAAASIFKTD